jgi:hypothetical protein
MSMMENAKLMREIAAHGLKFNTEICEKTLISTTTTMCNGKKLHSQAIDMNKMYGIFEQRLMKKLKGLGWGP